MPPEQVILFIVGTIVILFGAYYVTYYVGLKASGQTRAGMRNRNISMLDRYAISRDKQFCIVEVAGKVYVIGITNHTMTLLDTFDAADFAKLTENKEESATPWSMTPVGQYGNRLTRKVVEFIAEKTGKKQIYENKSGTADFSENLKAAERNANEADGEDFENPKKRDGSELPDLPNLPELPELPAEKTSPENQPESTEED